MCFTLHWDGTNAHGLEATPIAVGVANTNGQSTTAQTCIAYMPRPEGMGKSWETSAYVEIKFYLRQKCISAILAVMEGAARRGVQVSLLDRDKIEI